MTTADDLSNAEIQEFITKVKNLPGCKDIEQSEVEKQAHLFLRARKRDVARAVELYKANKRMRYAENVNSIDPLEEGVRKELLSGKFTVLPSTGTDDLSATIAIFTAHRHWPPLTTHRDTLKGVLYQLDAAMMDEQSQRKGLIVLYDMRDTKYSNFDYYLCIKLLNLFKGSYPARLRKVIIVEAPLWFRAPFGVLRLFVKEKMRDRIFTVGLDEVHVHLTPSLIESWFNQLTQHKHFDWLRQCLEKTGHASQTPEDYFTAQPPVYRGLSSSGSDLLQYDSLARSSSKTPRYNSLRYARNTYSFRQTPQPQSNSMVSPFGDESTSSSDDVPHSSVLRREHGSLNRMLTSMYSPVLNPTRSYLTSTGPSSFDSRHRSFRAPKSRARNNNCLRAATSLRLSSSSPSPSQDVIEESNETNPTSQTRLSVSEFIERVRTSGQLGLCAEFEAMFKDRPIDGSCDRFLQSENRRRNRYLDVPCLDATAVELSDGTYLHANWVHGYRHPRAYILAQGPLDNTRREFWMAVWEHRVPVIVMLTKIVENQRIKCAPYWPARSSLISQNSSIGSLSNHSYRSSISDQLTACTDEDSQGHIPPSSFYGDIQVVNVSESMECGGLYRHTRLQLRRKPSALTDDRRLGKQSDSSPKVHPSPSSMDAEKPFEVDHLLYLGWPDFDVPTDSSGFLTFLKSVKSLHEKRCLELDSSPSSTVQSPGPKGNYPLLVHCSAGIGRTGTFVTVDICLQQAIQEGYIDVPHVVSRLRCQRAGAVQVPKQYAFIHSALVSSLSKLSNGSVTPNSIKSPKTST